MEYETLLRLSVFLGGFSLLALVERLVPRRRLNVRRSQRWLTNWGFSIVNTLTLRLGAALLPALALGAALDAQTYQIGLFHQTAWPIWLEFVLAVLIFDFAIWAQHWATHHIPLLWRLHRVHHADRDMDVTTAIRFHPIEIAVSMGIKIGLVYLLGPSVWAILIFEVLLNATAMFSHANIALPAHLDRILRFFIVTPDMHRIHHSIHRHEHDSNFGFALSWWDRLFRTYRANPEHGHDQMHIGLAWQDDRPNRLIWSLVLPFLRK